MIAVNAVNRKAYSGSLETSSTMAKTNAYFWMAEPLLNLTGSLHKRMFGAQAIYLGGRIVLVVTEGEEPWNGLLFPVEKERQPDILQQFPYLNPHSILPKWLYLPATRDDFEVLGKELIELIRLGDERFGTLPKPRKSKRGSAAAHQQPDKKRTATDVHKALPDGRPPYLA